MIKMSFVFGMYVTMSKENSDICIFWQKIDVYILSNLLERRASYYVNKE
jgi:hypothetical protein